MYDYYANLIGVVDGDTLHCEVLLGCDVRTRLTIRLARINCPELPTPEGEAAKTYAQQWFTRYAPTGAFLLNTVRDRREKYGRYLGEVISANGENLNDDLLRGGHAVIYP